MVDIWRNQHHDVSLFTYFSKKPIIFSRIDFWLVPSFLSPFIKSNIKHSIKSDHSVILLNINSALHANRGPGFWKFNAYLLEDICFVNHVRENLKHLKEKYKDLEDKQLKWDCIKCELRGIIIKYSLLKARKTREREKELNKKTQLIASQPSPERLEEYQNLKNELEEIYNNKTKGVMLRSHAIWCEKGEKSTKYFLSLEKRNYKNKRIDKLVINNITLTNIETIIQEEKEYYQIYINHHRKMF